jgi:hypothetical protein
MTSYHFLQGLVAQDFYFVFGAMELNAFLREEGLSCFCCLEVQSRVEIALEIDSNFILNETKSCSR